MAELIWAPTDTHLWADEFRHDSFIQSFCRGRGMFYNQRKRARSSVG